MQHCIELVEDIHIISVGNFLVKHELIKNVSSIRSVTVDHRQDDGSFTVFVPGNGHHKFEFKGKQYEFRRSALGAPLTARLSHSNTAIHENISLCADSVQDITDFCREAFKSLQDERDHKIQTFIWDAMNEHWSRESFSNERRFESVILDPKAKKMLFNDLKEFTSEETREWYLSHGIPYHRGYMLYGPPGTGKTSTILAIASQLKRKIYRINLVAPKLCDNSLLTAFNNTSENSILVMEDIDALFGKFRDKQEEFMVTFSGFINAIDGIGDSSKGLIYMFTSNHPDKLDEAIRRPGRIDTEIALGPCTKEQIVEMFLRFYPDSSKDSQCFLSNILKLNTSVTPAQLQEHFIRNRKQSSHEAVSIDTKMFVMKDKSSEMYL